MKVARRRPRPSSPFPSVFGRIDRVMKEFCLGERAKRRLQGCRGGVIGGENRWVKSAPLLVPGNAKTCFIRGRVDVLVDCDDGTTGVVDFEDHNPQNPTTRHLRPPLHAYAMGLEAHPAEPLRR